MSLYVIFLFYFVLCCFRWFLRLQRYDFYFNFVVKKFPNERFSECFVSEAESKKKLSIFNYLTNFSTSTESPTEKVVPVVDGELL